MNEIYLRDRSSGRIHVAVRRGDRLLTDEGCNRDQAGEADEITADEMAGADPGDLCRHDFRTAIWTTVVPTTTEAPPS